MGARIASPNRELKLVGHGEEFSELLGVLTGANVTDSVILITGIGGIGKTTFARRLYDHNHVVNHFSFRAWVTLTQEVQLQHVPSEFLSCISDSTDTHNWNHERLCSELYRFLEGKTYLIVLDNMCHTEKYSDLRRCFPNNENGSRIIVTSRLEKLFSDFHNSDLHHHYMRRLYKYEAWELLCSIIFGHVCCPRKLRQAGRIIAMNCEGIPLAIVVVGGHLREIHKTKTAWREVAHYNGRMWMWSGRNVNYLRRHNQLLNQLKACFLTMRVLPEDYKVQFGRNFIEKAPQQTLQQIVLDMSHFINKFKIRREVLQKAQNVDYTTTDTGSKLLTMFNASSLSPNKEDKLIGLGKEFEEMLNCLTGQPSHLKVFAITGMAGIGKSTFSKRLYDHPLVVRYFYVHTWTTLSQQYQLKNVLLGLLSCISYLSDDIYEWTEEDLKERLYKSLKGQRYLIVLDDMWDTKVWNDLSRAFPNDSNGSRIILTSRLEDVCAYASSSIEVHPLRFLSPNESWELLCSKIFQKESCPEELVVVGMEIANKCQGLPLALVVVGGLLSEMTKTLPAWQKVAKSVTSMVMEDPERCQNILALSYNHLSDPLKSCLLYMGNFPEDHQLHAQRLIYLWVAEGFIPPKKEKSLEEVAEIYLESLITRSLVMVKRRSSNGRIKICCIHDIMRDFCLREAKKENFLCVLNSYTEEPQVDLLNERRVTLHSGIRKYMSLERLIAFTRARSFFCYEPLGPTDLKSCSGMYFKSLRVLDISSLHLESLPMELFRLTHLRYLAITIQNFLNISELFRLHSLQALFVCCEWDGHLPKEFWKMLELRHLYLKGSFVLPVLVNKILPDSGPLSMLHKLRTLSTIRPINCTEEVFRSMPNLRNLGIYETEDDYNVRGWLENLLVLEELETLKYVFSNPFVRPSFRERHALWHVFPPTLMKLTLSGTLLPWEDMSHLSTLPHLESLKLKNYAFSGPVWKPDEDGFPCLKFLLIGSTNLERWEADFSPFPRLQHLVLRHCIYLEEIPDVIGDIPTLEKIELQCCSDTAATSAQNLQEDRDWLTVYITKGTRTKFSRALEGEEDAPMFRREPFTWNDVATSSGVNDAGYTLRTSHDSGAITSKSKGKMPMVEDERESSDEENCTDDDDNALDCYLEDLENC